MKKPSRIAMALGVLLILTGLAWSGFSGQRIVDDIQNINSQDYTAKTTNFDSQQIKSIKTDLDNLRVTVDTKTSTNKVTVDYFETAEDKLAVEATDGTLHISRAKEKGAHFLCFFRCINAPHTITIHVPAGSSYSYDLTANNAPVAFENPLLLQAGSVRIESNNSSIELQNLSISGTVNLRSNNGSIKLQDIKAAEKVQLESSNARNELVRVEAPSIDTRADNGRILLDEVSAKDLTAHTSNAFIALTRLSVQRATLTSDNGSVKGTVVGSKEDYDIRMDSDNGSVQVDNVNHNASYFSEKADLNKSLTIRASNASVQVDFVK